jgi:hypothetical protein
MKHLTKFLERRKPISDLEQDIPYFAHLDSLSSKFNMYRRFTTPLLSLVLSYCYIEHLARTYTSRDELNKFLHRVGKKLSISLNILKKIKKRRASDAVHQIEDEIDETLLVELPQQPIAYVVYKTTGTEICVVETEPKDVERYPICYLLENEGMYYVLYTPMMTFIDGYDFYTGERKLNILPPFYLEQARKELLRGKVDKKSSSEANTPRFSSESVDSGDATSKSAIGPSDGSSVPKDNSDSDYTSNSKSSSNRNSLPNYHKRKDQLTFSSKVSSMSSQSSKPFATYSSEETPFSTDEEADQRLSVEHQVGARVFSVEASPVLQRGNLKMPEAREDDWFYYKLDRSGMNISSIYPRKPQVPISDRDNNTKSGRVDLCSKPCLII